MKTLATAQIKTELENMEFKFYLYSHRKEVLTNVLENRLEYRGHKRKAIREAIEQNIIENGIKVLVKLIEKEENRLGLTAGYLRDPDDPLLNMSFL